MPRFALRFHVIAALLCTAPALAADWAQFRGPGGLGISDETGLPTRWSATKNLAWKAELPGPGASSPITLGDRVFVTCYTGYGLEAAKGDQKDLMRHVLCLDRKTGKVRWHKEFKPKLPEHKYEGEGAYHGYAGSTPTTDGERLYVFFGKSGVYCLDLEGSELWHASVGEGTSGWGSGSSPVLLGKLLLVNASVESGSLVALDKLTGKEAWRAKGVGAAWNTPILVGSQEKPEIVVSVQDRVIGFDPATGNELWRAEGVHRYVCPSVVWHDDAKAGHVVLAIGGGSTSLAVRAGGRGDVTKSHGLWRMTKGSNVGSPIYHDGHLYWASDSGGFVCCQNAATGETVYQERLEPRPGNFWSSPILADGKLYFVSQHAGTYVVAAKPKFELLAHNVIAGDDSRTNASPAVSDGQILLRTDRCLYCLGDK
jgi:outer membrane protein assembly factor BamB